MVQLQILSKVLQTKDSTILTENLLTKEFFVGYEDEFNFINTHIEKYGNVPDIETFLSAFPSFEVVEVTETDHYLVNTIREEYLYYRTVPVIQKVAELLKTDSNAAAEYMISELPHLEPNYDIGGVDIIHNARDRFDQYVERKARPKDWFLESGFQELDDVIHGLQRGEELFVIVARTSQGKSWLLAKMCAHVWKTGYNVGYISPEMSAMNVGFRFDTLIKNFSNRGLMWGKDDVQEDEYEQYIDDLKTKTNKFIVATPKDFDNRITVTRVKNWIKQYKLDMVAIDGITYLSDERFRKGDSKNTSLTNISEDLMSLSVEMGVPIVVVVQANRTGVIGDDDDGTPELESIRDSDGISHNASKVISIRQKKNSVLEIGVKKNRGGSMGNKLTYTWDINTGEFVFIPCDDTNSVQTRRKSGDNDNTKTVTDAEKVKRKYNDSSDVF